MSTAPEWLSRAAHGDVAESRHTATIAARLITRLLLSKRHQARHHELPEHALHIGPAALAKIEVLYEYVRDRWGAIGDTGKTLDGLAFSIAHEPDEPSYSRIPSLQKEFAEALADAAEVSEGCVSGLAIRIQAAWDAAEGRLSIDPP